MNPDVIDALVEALIAEAERQREASTRPQSATEKEFEDRAGVIPRG